MKKAGIISIGAYVPYYYLPRSVIAQAWGAKGGKGKRSIISYDEDSVTLAYEAAEDCFRFIDRRKTDALLFASTTAPYAEKSHSGLVSHALNLGKNVFTADFAQCTKSATAALRLAVCSCMAGTFQQIIVTAADCRDAYPKTVQEQMFGDASGAVAVGVENVIATVDEFATTTNEITDIWRNASDPYVSRAEDRFVTNHGYLTEMTDAVNELLTKADLSADDVNKYIFTTSNMKDHLTLAKRLKLPVDKIQDPYMTEVGYTGTAQPLFLLAAALEQALPGEKIVLASYGNGADAFLFTVTEEIEKVKKNGIQKYLNSRKPIDEYARFLSFRGLLQADPGQPYQIKSSTAAEWRNQDTYIHCLGSRCNKCGASIFPVNRVCSCCGAVDDYSTFRVADRTAAIFTYTLDNYAGRSDFPLVGQIVAEDEDGARYYMNTTDFVREDIKIGEKLEFTFRKVHNLAGFVNYYWKMRPLRRKEE